MTKLLNKLKKLHIHKYIWTDETRKWFFTGIANSHIGSACKKCGKKVERL